jgi:predicted MarR family transcription regulator
MASSALSLVDVRRNAVAGSNDLSPVERTALEFIRKRAAENKPVTRADIAIAIGSQNLWGGTAPGVLNRLEAKGHITRTYYQRGLQVCDVKTGKCTAAPASRATHWRQRTEDVQTPPLHALRQRRPALTRVIEQEASKLNIALPDFLMDLVANGIELWLEKRENEE